MCNMNLVILKFKSMLTYEPLILSWWLLKNVLITNQFCFVMCKLYTEIRQEMGTSSSWKVHNKGNNKYTTFQSVYEMESP